MDNIKESVHRDFEKLKLNKNRYFDEFYRNNYKLVYRICFSVLKNEENSEDITQTVFEKILKMKEEQLPQDHESSWLYTVTKNEALQLIRKTKPTDSDEKFDSIQSDTNEIDDIVEDESYDKIIKKLNKKQEQIVSMKIISNFTFKEIGQIMSMPTATVQWYYYSSLKYLKVALSNFVLFIVTLAVGLKTMWKSEENELNKSINNTNKKVQEDYKQSESSISLDSAITPPNLSTFSEVMEHTGNSTERADSAYIGILSVAGIFFVVTIIFSVLFIKNKHNDKK